MFPHRNTMDKSYYQDVYYKFYNFGYREGKNYNGEILLF